MQLPQKTRSASRRRVFSLLGWIASGTLVCATAPLNAQEASAEAGQTKAATCAACHGADGNSAQAIWPSLASQHADYVVDQLVAYTAGERADAGMQSYAAALSEQDMADIAAWYSEQAMTAKGADPELVDRAERIYRGGIPERGVAACIACHGPTGQGNPLAGYPRVSHQHAAYLAKTLREYRSATRRSDAAMNQMMRNVAELLLDDEIDALASYMQGLN